MLVAILLMIFDRLEYAWVPWEGVEKYITIPFVYDSGPIRIDALIYAASVKLQHIILVLILYVLTPFTRANYWMLGAFMLAFVELFLTWNEPILTIPIPFKLWIPVSTATLKFVAVCNFMWCAVKKAME